MDETTYEVRQRYTAGTPGRTQKATAGKIALEEGLTYFFESARSARAKALGLHGVVLAITPKSDHDHVLDMITGEEWEWPYRGACEFCGGKNLPTVRGFVAIHGSCKAAPFVGRLTKGDFLRLPPATR